jgi:hypothetical protein
MSFSNRFRRRLIRRLALGLAVAAVLAPAAQASLDPGGMPCTPACSWLESAGADVRPTVPDDRAVRPTIVSGPSAAGQYSVDGPRSGPVTNLPTFSTDAPRTAPDAIVKPVAVPVAGSGFDWSDAGVGIGIAFGVALLGAALLTGGRRRGTLQGA